MGLMVVQLYFTCFSRSTSYTEVSNPLKDPR